MLNTLLIGAALVLAAPAPKEAPKTTAKLEGNWLLTDAVGVKGKEDVAKDHIRFIFADGNVTILTAREKGDRAEKATYEVDLTKKPATIDIKPTNGPKDLVVKGIIEISGDTLKLCFGRDGADRPAEFKGDVEKNVQLMTFKREEEKKGEEEKK